MRIRISHATTYHYDAPPNGVTQLLRLTPRNHDGQYVVEWRIELSEDCQLHQHEDAFGNITHSFTADGPFDELSITVNGEVETQDSNGFVRGAVERFPPPMFLRESPLTLPDTAIIDFAEAARAEAGPGASTLSVLHQLLANVNGDITFDVTPTQTATTAAEAFKLKRGVCQDLTHIYIAAARHLGIPSRYIGGHFYRADGITAQDAGHAWAECYVEDFGWIGFDPSNGICPTDAHVRVAAGLDYLGASPVRGTRYGGNGETLKVAVNVEQARQQSQTQSQS
jgi:transglutaminase-like putative cysteine protease